MLSHAIVFSMFEILDGWDQFKWATGITVVTELVSQTKMKLVYGSWNDSKSYYWSKGHLFLWQLLTLLFLPVRCDFLRGRHISRDCWTQQCWIRGSLVPGKPMMYQRSARYQRVTIRLWEAESPQRHNRDLKRSLHLRWPKMVVSWQMLVALKVE